MLQRWLDDVSDLSTRQLSAAMYKKLVSEPYEKNDVSRNMLGIHKLSLYFG